ncbi:MAG: LacI family DNA-binding transcriptional regulator [Pseudomonadota bacterium]
MVELDVVSTGEPTLPTLSDVARKAGVSTATVSRCLNTPETVKKKTRDTVMRAVDSLGYTPHFGARAMAAKRTFTIGAIIPTMENAIFARGVQAFQERLHEKGYTLLVSSSAYRPELEAEQVKALVARGADGLLLIGYERQPEIYAFLRRRQTPFLLAWAFKSDSALPSIGFDNNVAMQTLTRQVLAKGHRQIAIISGTIEGNDRAAERVKGIHAGLLAVGIDPDSVPLIETPYGIENGANAFHALMQTTQRPTAVMCVNDVLAVGALQRAREMGLRVPDDLSITGFDDIELAKVVTPQLTTVHVPHRQMGQLAADELVQMVESKVEGTSAELTSQVRLRGSLAEPPK